MTIHHPNRRQFVVLGAAASEGLAAQTALANAPAHYP